MKAIQMAMNPKLTDPGQGSEREEALISSG
jgi:hypothetical protein